MKVKKLVSLLAAVTLSVSAIPTVTVSASSSWGSSAAIQKTVTVDFMILGYKENKDGQLTITGCYDYDPLFKCNGGYIAVCVFNGDLQIPSSIDGKPVTGLKNLSGNTNIDKVIIPETVTEVGRSAFTGCNLVTETTDQELNLITIYC